MQFTNYCSHVVQTLKSTAFEKKRKKIVLIIFKQFVFIPKRKKKKWSCSGFLNWKSESFWVNERASKKMSWRNRRAHINPNPISHKHTRFSHNVTYTHLIVHRSICRLRNWKRKARKQCPAIPTWFIVGFLHISSFYLFLLFTRIQLYACTRHMYEWCVLYTQ